MAGNEGMDDPVPYQAPEEGRRMSNSSSSRFVNRLAGSLRSRSRSAHRGGSNERSANPDVPGEGIAAVVEEKAALVESEEERSKREKKERRARRRAKKNKRKWQTLTLRRNPKPQSAKERPHSVHMSSRAHPPVITLESMEEMKKKVTEETTVFGIDLGEAAERSHHLPDIPAPLSDCILFLDANGLDDQGLYRVPGNKTRVDYHRHRYDAGLSVSIHPKEDPATAASLLLLFIREIPGGLFTKWGTNALRQIDNSNEEARVAREARHVIELLPASNRECLRLFFQHLHRVQANSKSNLMTAKNIALCVFPATCPIALAVLMIVHCDEVFDTSGQGDESIRKAGVPGPDADAVLVLVASHNSLRHSNRSLIKGKKDAQDAGSPQGGEDNEDKDIEELVKRASQMLKKDEAEVRKEMERIRGGDVGGGGGEAVVRSSVSPPVVRRNPSVVHNRRERPEDEKGQAEGGEAAAGAREGSVHNDNLFDFSSPRPPLRATTSLPNMLAYGRSERLVGGVPAQSALANKRSFDNGPGLLDLASPAGVGAGAGAGVAAARGRRSLRLVQGLSVRLSAKLGQWRAEMLAREVKQLEKELEQHRLDLPQDGDGLDASAAEHSQGPSMCDSAKQHAGEKGAGALRQESLQEDDDLAQLPPPWKHAMFGPGGVLDAEPGDLEQLEAPMMGIVGRAHHESVTFS